MEDAEKRSDLGVHSKFNLIEHASDVMRLKKAFDLTKHKRQMDAKRRFDSIDHFSDMSVLKRLFDAIA